jgi:hypothetical protein
MIPFDDGRRTSAAVIDLYEAAGIAVADFQVKLAGGLRSEAAAFLTAACADFTREITAAQASAVRTVLRI